MKNPGTRNLYFYPAISEVSNKVGVIVLTWIWNFSFICRDSVEPIIHPHMIICLAILGIICISHMCFWVSAALRSLPGMIVICESLRQSLHNNVRNW